MESIINVHYGAEIALKGGNRTWFEDLLVKNIRQMVPEATVVKKESRILIELGAESNTEEVVARFQRIFGIEWYSRATKTNANMQEMEEAVAQLSHNWEKVPIRVETKRSDKSFPHESMEINKRVGQRL